MAKSIWHTIKKNRQFYWTGRKTIIKDFLNGRYDLSRTARKDWSDL